MTTKSELATALATCHEAGARAAVAVVIETDGSVYRRAGARSIVLEDGRILGVISGGCAEQDLLEHAKDTWETGRAKHIEYDFRSPEDLLWGMGAGCNGALSIYLLPFDPLGNPHLADALLVDMQLRATVTDIVPAVTVLTSSDTDKYPIGPVFDALLADVLKRLPNAPSKKPQFVALTLDGIELELFVEQIMPRPHLTVIGSGDDAIPLVRFAVQADWHVTLIDHRSIMNNETRFPQVDVRAVIRRDEYARLDVRNTEFVVMMTHNYAYDKQILRSLLPQHFPYLGLLGPRARFDRLRRELTDEGMELSDTVLAKVHSPVGIDIGADTPDEIALSILAEVTAKLRGSGAGFLRDRDGPIHES